MSNAIKELRDYLAKSPSVVYPQDVLEYLPAIEAENAKLREELEQWHRLTAGIELPEYPITEFKPKDLERENAKLRELVQTLVHCLNDVDCDKCPLNGNPYEVRGEWAACDALRDRMRELGVEVDG